MTKQYNVGLALNSLDLTPAQRQEAVSRLKGIRKTLPDWEVHLVVPGFQLNEPEGTVAREVRMLCSRDGVIVKVLGCIGNGRHREKDAAPLMLRGLFHECDEIWCCSNQAITRSSRSRVARLYWLAQENPHIAARYKIIQPWTVDSNSHTDVILKARKDRS